MKVAKYLFQDKKWSISVNNDSLQPIDAQLVLGFGERELLDNDFFSQLKQKFPNANIALCSSSGEIFCKETFENTVSVIALGFSKATALKTAHVKIENFENSYDAGVELMNNLPKQDLKWVFVLSDGSHVNGSELVKGLNFEKPENLLISGGLAGDGNRFETTVVGLNEVPTPGNIVAIGFYGEKLQLSHASLGGWETFGLERTVTKSVGNKLYEIDGKNALDLYKKYLGKYAHELPGSALLFPLSMELEDRGETVVRTILSINEAENYMVFAGDIPVGSNVRFMKANFDRLIDAANDAAVELKNFSGFHPQLAILISCVGRKLVLGNRLSEEVEAVRDILGEETALVGFYSYGEISPLKPLSNCELHNQTITITGISENE